MHWTEIVEHASGAVTVLLVRGHMTLADEEAALFHRIADLADEGHIRILINLRHVPYIDSVGIGEIVRAFMRLVRGGGSLKLCEVTPGIADVIKATNLDTVLEVFATEDEAVRQFH
jgi:anti-anti-sigma factor